MTGRNLKSTVLAAAAVIALTGVAGAQVNTIGIDISGGGPTTLAITQSDASLGNLGGGGSLQVGGQWNTFGINQADAKISFNGALTSHSASPTASSSTGPSGS